MITEAILNVVFGLFKVLLDLVPSFSIGLNVTAAFTQIASWIAWANYYLPLEDFVVYAFAVLVVWVTCAIFSFFLQIF